MALFLSLFYAFIFTSLTDEYNLNRINLIRTKNEKGSKPYTTYEVNLLWLGDVAGLNDIYNFLCYAQSYELVMQIRPFHNRFHDPTFQRRFTFNEMLFISF